MTNDFEDVGSVGVNFKLLGMRYLLDDEANEMEVRVAKEKDRQDYDNFKSKFEFMQKNLKTAIASPPDQVQVVIHEFNNLIEHGYKSGILQNDSELEKECRASYMAMAAIVEGRLPAENKGKFMESSQGLLEKMAARGFLQYLDLSGKLDTAEKQRAWVVLNPQIVSDYIAVLKPDDAQPMAELLRDFTKNVVNQGKLEADIIPVIESRIQNGLERGLKLHTPTAS